MSGDEKPAPFSGRKADLVWNMHDVDPWQFAQVFEKLGVLMSTGLPGSTIDTVHFSGDTLTVSVVTR